MLRPERRNDLGLQAVIRQTALSVGLEGFGRHQEIAMARPDSRPRLSAIEVETLVIVGDFRSADAAALRARDRFRHRWREASCRSGLRPPIERPEAVALGLKDWISA
jgi:hypothetical protein